MSIMSAKIPYGYCHCGCGRPTVIVTRNIRRSDRRKGQPNLFLQGHHARLHNPGRRKVPDDQGRYQCTKCGHFKPVLDFSSRATASNGVMSQCATCKGLQTKNWSQMNPDKKRENERRARFRQRYGISVEEYLALLDRQNGLCAICGRAERHVYKDGRSPALSVDHNHQTGACRGLLCKNCNNAIGLLDDNPELIRRALHYLQGSTNGDIHVCTRTQIEGLEVPQG